MRNPLIALASSIAIFLLLSANFVSAAEPIESKPFGKTADGKDVTQYILTNKTGSSCRLITFGAIVTNLFISDKDGKMGDVVLGYDSVKGYELSGPFMGCIAGRFANRIANGTFTID